MPRHVRKGDVVIVTAGNARGTVGEVLAVDTKSHRVTVKGVNVRTKRLRKRRRPMSCRSSMPSMPARIRPIVMV